MNNLELLPMILLCATPIALVLMWFPMDYIRELKRINRRLEDDAEFYFHQWMGLIDPDVEDLPQFPDSGNSQQGEQSSQ